MEINQWHKHRSELSLLSFLKQTVYIVENSLQYAPVFVFRVLIGDIVFTFGLKIVAAITGLTVYSYYAQAKCDPIQGGLVHSPNKVKCPALLLRFT